MALTIDLSGKTALVTGCRRGIGRATAVALARAGADIVGVSASLANDGGEVGEEVRRLGRAFTPCRCDLSDRDAIHALIADLDGSGAAIDILVNNAGTIRRAPAAEHGDADWDAVIAVNLTSGFLLTREFGRRMLERGQGKVVFVASVLSFQGGLNVPSYAASKGAVVQLVRAFANEWASQGVNVNAVAPGYVATDNTAALRQDPERTQELLSRVPAGRWGSPDDVAGGIVFLASPAAEFIHGAVLPIDGGWLAR
jgi:2-deoxy-D-gluconate 3-dehydrogenase